MRGLPKIAFPLVMTLLTLYVVQRNVFTRSDGVRLAAKPVVREKINVESSNTEVQSPNNAVSGAAHIFESSGVRMSQSKIEHLEANDINRNVDVQPDSQTPNQQSVLMERLAAIAAERDALQAKNEAMVVELADHQHKLRRLDEKKGAAKVLPDEKTDDDDDNNNKGAHDPNSDQKTPNPPLRRSPVVHVYTNNPLVQVTETHNNKHTSPHSNSQSVSDGVDVDTGLSSASASTWDPYDVTPLEDITNDMVLRPKPQIVDPRYSEAVKWLTIRQTRTAAECETYGVIGVHLSDHIPGFPGLGALLQAFVMKVVAVVTLTKQAFEPIGHLRWYTENSVCNELVKPGSQSGWTCVYKPLSTCSTAKNVTAYYDHFNFTKRGTGTPALSLINKAMAIPPSNEKFFFPPQLLNETGTVKNANSIYASPIVNTARNAQQIWWGAIHGYVLRLNKRAEARVARVRIRGGLASIDIALHIRIGDKLTDPMSMQLVKVAKGPEYYLEQAASLARHIRSTECAKHGPCAPVVVYVASDSRPAVKLAYAWEKRQNEIMGTNAVRVVGLCSQTQIISSAAGTRGIDEDIRNNTGKADKSSVAEEVIVDLAVLQEARYFVGLCMSQMARAAVAIGLAKGTMEHAIAIDEENLVMWTPTKPAITKWESVEGYRGWRGLYKVVPADRIKHPDTLVLPELEPQPSTVVAPGSIGVPEPALCIPQSLSSSASASSSSSSSSSSFKSDSGANAKAVGGDAESRTTSSRSARGLSTLPKDSIYHNWITLVTVSGSFLRMFQNWLLFYIRLAIPVPVVVMALDEVAHKWIKTNMAGAIAEVKHANELVKITVNDAFNSQAYNKIVTQRPTQILAYLQQGTHVLYVDIDSVMLRDPFPWFVGDMASIWAANDAADKSKAGPFHACTGFLAMKSTPDSLRLIELWEEKMAVKLQRNQMVFNKVISDEGAIEKEVRFLPEPIFRRGKELNKDFIHPDMFINNTVASDIAWIHGNYLIGLIPKVMALRKWGAWPLPI